MTTTGPLDPEILVVGSVPAKNADEAIDTVYAALGPYLRRVPDGETGERRNWIAWQYPLLAGHPAFEVDPSLAPQPFATEKGGVVGAVALLRLKDGVDPSRA
jgi:hypothetical protein